MRSTCRITKATNHTLRICYNYFFPTAAMVRWMRLGVTLLSITYLVYFLPWLISPNPAYFTSVLKFLAHTRERARTHAIRPTQDLSLLWTNDRFVERACTYKTHNKHKRRTSKSSVGFEPAFPAAKRFQPYTLDRTAPRISWFVHSPFSTSFLVSFVKVYSEIEWFC